MRGGRNIRICGGGLTGLSLGVALAERGVPVIVLEKGRYPRHRVCGEFICGVSREVLESLRIAPVFEDAVPLHSMMWWHRGKVILEEPLAVPARGISRYELDCRLAERLVSLGGDLRCGERCDPPEAETEGVVWTAGRPQTKEGKWIGLKCHLENFALSADLEMHLGPGGYAGLSRIEAGKVNLCGLFQVDPGIKARMPDLLIGYLRRAGAMDLIDRIRAARIDKESCCSIAGFSMGFQSSPTGVLSAGDACRMIPPFTGNGMSMAFESADLLVKGLLPWISGEVSWEMGKNRVEASLSDHFKKRMDLARLLHPPLLHPALQRITAEAAARGLLPTGWLFRRLRAS